MKTKFSKNVSIVVLAGLFSLISARVSFSQTVDVDRATRETDVLTDSSRIQKQFQKIPKKLPDLQGEEKAAPVEGEKYPVKKINLTGVESFSSADFTSIISKYENRDVTFGELDTLSKEIERDYLRRGVIAAVVVPPQEIKDGLVNLQVVEAKMGELIVQDAKFFNKKRLVGYWKIPAGQTMRYEKISKSVQMMNKNPDRQVKAALRAGQKPGTTDVILTPETSFPFHLTSSFDNEGVPSTGRSRTGVGFRHNNLLGFDDTLIGGYTMGNYFSGWYTYHNVPINKNGASIIYGYSHSDSSPQKEYSLYKIKSEASSYDFSLHQDLYKKDDYLGEVYTGFNAKDKTTKMYNGTHSRDRLRVWSAGGNFVLRSGSGNTTTIAPEISQGIGAFGADTYRNPLLTAGAEEPDMDFTKFNLAIQHKMMLPLSLQANLKFRSQVSSTVLAPSEQFSIGGIDSVRGYPAGDYLADNAVLASAELLIPSFFIPKDWRLPYAKDTLRDQVTLLAFLDYGYGDRRGSNPGTKHVNDLGIGTGIRVRLYDQFYLRFEWGFPVGTDPLTEGGNSQFHFSVDFQEKIPGEIDRAKKLRQEHSGKRISAKVIDREPANEYARTATTKEDALAEYNRLALTEYNEGNLAEAKALWEKVLAEGNA